jgi:hypothetical protein
MRSFPFTNYDFFGYIASGFVLIFAIDRVLETGWMIRPSWTVVEGMFVLACAYGVGHLLAGLASALIERRFVRRYLRPPTQHLLGAGGGPAWFKKIYPVYFEPLPNTTQDRIRERAAAAGITEPGEAMFWAAFDVAKNKKAAYKRMSDFLNNYGLCRNLSFTAGLCALLLLGVGHRSDVGWAIAAMILSVGMLFRYLKFYRHYALEVFTTYAHAESKGKAAGSRARARPTKADQG